MLDGLDDTTPESRRPPAGVIAAGLTLLVAAAIGVVLVFRFVDNDRDRDLRGWQVRLGIVADSRAASINEWLDRQTATVGSLAENASLQLYMSELAASGYDPAKVNEGAAQAGYLRNLLLVTADRAGFTAATPARRVAANIQRPGSAGLALVDPESRVLVATPDLLPIDGRLRDFVTARRIADRAVLDLYGSLRRADHGVPGAGAGRAGRSGRASRSVGCWASRKSATSFIPCWRGRPRPRNRLKPLWCGAQAR